MPEPIELHPGDACPVCGGAFAPARRLTVEEFARIYDRENPQPVPPLTDTMRPDLVREHGALYLCTRCEYKTRFADEESRRTGTGRGDRQSDGRAAPRDAEPHEAQTDRELTAARQRIAELEQQLKAHGSPPGADDQRAAAVQENSAAAGQPGPHA